MVRAKKYFYVMRPILACKWILHYKTKPPTLYKTACIGYAAVFAEIIIVLLIQECNEFFVVVEYISVGLWVPVDVDFLEVAIHVLKVWAYGLLRPFFG